MPEQTVCRDLNPAGPLFRANVHLKLDYCLTRIFIGRPFLFSNIKGISQTLPQSSQQKGSSGLSKNRATLVTDCVEAALEIIDLCRLLRDEAGLARSSFTEFSSCRAALLVILAQGLKKCTQRLGAALEQGISLIKIMSMGVGSARSAVSVIEALERAIRRLEVWSETQQAQSNGGVESAYDRFKNWEMLWKAGPLSPSTINWPQAESYFGNEPDSAQRLGSVDVASAATATAAAAGMSMTSPTTTLPGRGNIEPGLGGGPDNDLLEGEVPSSALSDTFSLSQQSLAQIPSFGLDHFVSNFPQELGEFTAIPFFETDAHQSQPPSAGLVNTDSKPATGDGADPRWMQFMNE